MDRRQFLKISAAIAGVAAAGYCAPSIFSMAKQSALAAPLFGPQKTSSTPSGSMEEDLRVPHLLRRAGFGASAKELSGYKDMGFESAVHSLLDYASVENVPLPPPDISLAYSRKPIGDELSTLAGWWIDRMALTARPLEEKMTLFWHNHFATGYSKVQNGYLMYQQNEFLRNNALGNFRDLLNGITIDAAMLVWLDGVLSNQSHPNENYARELMEVFTTGRGPYTQTDVEESARAFTGYSIDANGNGYVIPSQQDDGPKVFLGQSGDFGPEDIIDILVARPETAAQLSTELFEFFAYPNPDEETISRLSDVYFQSDYSVMALVEAILTSEEFVSEKAYLANVKSPVEYVATALRSLGATAPVTDVASTIGNQGQMLFDPPSVFGWPSGMMWINTGSLVERFNFPMSIELPAQAGEPRVLAESLSKALFPDGMPAAILELVQSSVAGTPDPALRATEAVRLVMSSPFYNLN